MVRKLRLNILLLVGCFMLTSSNSPKRQRKTINTNHFEKEIKEFYKQLRLPGLAVGVQLIDSTVFFKGFGYSNPVSKESITEKNIFEIASLTKGFTSVLLHQLEEKNKISLSNELKVYPNRFFDKHRFIEGMTIDHVISHTSETIPLGNHFIYNGGKYNLVFNVFDKLNEDKQKNENNEPFIREIEKSIIEPIGLKSTIGSYSKVGYNRLKNLMVPQYQFNSITNEYQKEDFDFNRIKGVPSTGFLSSVNDLFRFSLALDRNELISKKNYHKMTQPFYQGSPYGKGWFTYVFEGTEIHWAYGLGSTNSALLVRVPSKQLSLVALCNTAGLNDYFRLGYGNPLNSIVITAFMKYFVLENENRRHHIDYEKSNLKEIEKKLVSYTKDSKSEIYLEEALANVMYRKFAPEQLYMDKRKSAEILLIMNNHFPHYFKKRTREMFELIASFDSKDIKGLGNTFIDCMTVPELQDPIKSFYASVIAQKAGRLEEAVDYLEHVANDNQFTEQPVKLNACMKLAEFYKGKNELFKTKFYLRKVVSYMENISRTNDTIYKEATTILKSL